MRAASCVVMAALGKHGGGVRASTSVLKPPAWWEKELAPTWCSHLEYLPLPPWCEIGGIPRCNGCAEAFRRGRNYIGRSKWFASQIVLAEQNILDRWV